MTYHKTIKRRRIEDDDESQEISDQDLEEEEELYVESKDNKSKKKKSSSKQSKAKKKAKAKNYITVTSKDILKGHFKFINNRKTPLNKQVSKEYREVTDQLIRNQWYTLEVGDVDQWKKEIESRSAKYLPQMPESEKKKQEDLRVYGIKKGRGKKESKALNEEIWRIVISKPM